jgi:hypothetical protein
MGMAGFPQKRSAKKSVTVTVKAVCLKSIEYYGMI